MHSHGDIPEELIGVALVPIVGGLASQQHCSAHILLRECDALRMPGLQVSAVLKCLAAAGCLCAADGRSGSMHLTLPSGERGCPDASLERIFRALQAAPRQQLLTTLGYGSAAAVSANEGGPSSVIRNAAAVAKGAPLRRVLARAAVGHSAATDAATWLEQLPVFKFANAAFATASAASPVLANWETILKGCKALALPHLLLHTASETQRKLMAAAGIAAPAELEWLLSVLLPHIAARLNSVHPSGQRKTLVQLQLMALDRLEAFPLGQLEQGQLRSLRLVVDSEGALREAVAFVQLEAAADGLRPLMSGAAAGLQALPADYGGVAGVLRLAGLHTEMDGPVLSSIAKRCDEGALLKLTRGEQLAFQGALAAAAAKQMTWDERRVAGMRVFQDTSGALVAAEGSWVARTEKLERLLHAHRAALPAPVLKWHTGDRRMLTSAGYGVGFKKFLSMGRTLLPHIASKAEDRSLEPIVLLALERLEKCSSSGDCLAGLSVIYGDSGPAPPPSAYLLLEPTDGTIERLLPEKSYPRLPERYHSLR